jgi:hypothetical protein
VNIILICYSCSLRHELCNIFKHLINHLYITTFSCILVTRHEHNYLFSMSTAKFSWKQEITKCLHSVTITNLCHHLTFVSSASDILVVGGQWTLCVCVCVCARARMRSIWQLPSHMMSSKRFPHVVVACCLFPTQSHRHARIHIGLHIVPIIVQFYPKLGCIDRF